MQRTSPLERARDFGGLRGPYIIILVAIYRSCLGNVIKLGPTITCGNCLGIRFRGVLVVMRSWYAKLLGVFPLDS